MPGALTFGAATGDRVTIAPSATINNLDPCTVLMWVNVTTLTSGRMLWAKSDATNVGKRLQLNGTTGNLQVTIQRVVNTSYITNNTPLATLGGWACIAFTYNSSAAAGQVVNIYKGDLATLATECTYGTATDGSGANTSEAAFPLYLGNGMALTGAFQGREALCALFGVELSLADIQSWQARPRAVVGTNTGRCFHRLGNEGTGSQQDYTGNGNTGTVTGATQSDGPPLDEGDLLWQRDALSGLLTMAA